MPRRAEVHVNIYDECDVDCEVANVSIQEEDEILWHSTGDAFTVDFGAYTPFEKSTFDVPAGGSIRSRSVRKDALEVTYHYVIRRKAHGSGSASAAADPDVNVKR